MLLGKPLHLEVRLLNSPDPNLVLLVHFCVAYPRSGKAVWVLLYNGYAKKRSTLEHRRILLLLFLHTNLIPFPLLNDSWMLFSLVVPTRWTRPHQKLFSMIPNLHLLRVRRAASTFAPSSSSLMATSKTWMKRSGYDENWVTEITV